MFGSGSVARKSSGFFRLYAQLVYRGARGFVLAPQPWILTAPKPCITKGFRPQRSALEIRQRTLSEPELADLDRTGSEIKRVNRLIKELAARPNPSFTGFLMGYWLGFGTVLSGLDIQGLTEMRQSLGSQVPIYLVTHRSHLDYLLISWLCIEPA